LTIKKREDWPSPPGYRFENAEGKVIKWVEHDESAEHFQDFVFVKLEKVEGEGKEYNGNSLLFQLEELDKIQQN
jgi:hypothetical protein